MFYLFVATLMDTLIGAAVQYTVNGANQTVVGIPFDDPAAAGITTFYRGLLGPFQPGDVVDYAILLNDDVGNEFESDPYTITLPTAGDIIGKVDCPSGVPEGCDFLVKVSLDMTGTTSPNHLLGSFRCIAHSFL